MVATTCRRLGQVDDVVDRFLEKPLPRRASGVRHLLRLGAAQLLFLGTPAHAAVSTVVTEARRRHRAYAALINAVLRRVAREGPAIREDQDAARLNTPDWLWRSWVDAYGEPTARAIAEAHSKEPPLDLTVRTDAPGWATRLGGTPLPTGGVRLVQAGPVTKLDGFSGGDWWVQDAAAALPVRLLGNVRGHTVIDLCAAPGGKTAQLAVAGARVTAVDRTPSRLDRLRQNLHRLGAEANVICADATVWRPPAPADAVLVDVPCSATGTIRRHPDVARIKRARDITSLAESQRHLLDAAASMVRPGGIVVYCACSLQPEEGPGVIDAVVRQRAPIALDPVTSGCIAGVDEQMIRGGALRTLPCHWADIGGLDGFFAVRLRRL